MGSYLFNASNSNNHYTTFSARLNDMLRFDTATLTWSDGSPPAAAPRPAPRESMGFAWANGAIYLHGGLTDAGPRNTHAIARALAATRESDLGLHLRAAHISLHHRSSYPSSLLRGLNHAVHGRTIRTRSGVSRRENVRLQSSRSFIVCSLPSTPNTTPTHPCDTIFFRPDPPKPRHMCTFIGPAFVLHLNASLPRHPRRSVCRISLAEPDKTLYPAEYPAKDSCIHPALSAYTCFGFLPTLLGALASTVRLSMSFPSSKLFSPPPCCKLFS